MCYKWSNKKIPIDKMPKSRNDSDIFTMDKIEDIPYGRLIFIEEINGEYNAFDIIKLRKHLFTNNIDGYKNPLTTNEILSNDLNKILNTNVRQIKYFT